MVVLIVSQYYGSHHCFFAAYHPASFYEQARGCIEELEDYKRSEIDGEKYNYGDLDEKYYVENSPRKRYNVNDAGDLYFIIADTATSALKETRDFRNDREGHVYEIADHHSESRIEEIVSRHFEML